MVEISEDTAVNRPQTDLVLSKSLREVTHEDNERRIKASVKVLQSVRAAQSSVRHFYLSMPHTITHHVLVLLFITETGPHPDGPRHWCYDDQL